MSSDQGELSKIDTSANDVGIMSLLCLRDTGSIDANGLTDLSQNQPIR